VAAFFIAHLVLETITHYNSENDYLTQETQRLVEGKNTKADVGLNCTGRVSFESFNEELWPSESCPIFCGKLPKLRKIC
jgi:hypothetical protein